MQDVLALDESRPLPPSGGTRRGAVDFLLALGVTTVWAWPTIRSGAGFLRDRYDAQTQLWVTGWVRHALLTRPFSLFQANAFAPSPDVLALSEPLIGYGAAGLPLQLLGFGDVLVFNLVCLLALAFSLWAISRLAQALGVSRGASIVGAMAGGLGACQTNSLGYVSFTAFGGIALVLLAWMKVAREPRLRSAVSAGLVTAGLAWFSLQLFAFSLVALAFVMLLVLAGIARPRPWRELALGAALTALLVLPLALPLLRVRQAEGFRRTEAETRTYSAVPGSWLTTTSANPGQAWLSRRSDSETALYPGTVALVLAALACFLAIRRPRARAAVAIGAFLTIVGVLGSLGYNGPLYPVLASLVPPLFGGIRAVARFASVAQVGFGLLAGVGLSLLLGLFRPPPRNAILCGAFLLVLLDTRPSVTLASRPEQPHPPVERLLARSTVGGPILHLPLEFGASQARLLVASMEHFKPIVNGTLSYVPRRHEALAALLDASPIAPSTMDVLEGWPVAAIVLHEHATPLERLPATLEFLGSQVRNGRLSNPVRLEHRGGDDWLFGVLKVRGSGAWAEAEGTGDDSSRASFLSIVDEAATRSQLVPSVDDPSIPASIDNPAELELVHGSLVARGWAQTRLGPVKVLEALLDGDRRLRSQERRTPRPDVATVIPSLGACTEAGYELTFPFLSGDAGKHELRIRFVAPDGKVRTLLRAFSWAP